MIKLLNRTNIKDAVALSQIALAAAALGLVGATLLWQVFHHFLSPIHDDIFDRLRYYRAVQDGFSQVLSYLVTGHNEHRIFTTRLVEILDEYIFSGREYLQVILSNLIQLGCAVLCFSRMRKNDDGVIGALFLFSVLALCFINPNFFYTLVVPFQIQHAIMTLLVIGAALLCSAPASDSPPPGIETRFILMLLLLALVATFTLANAPVILISAASASLVARRPKSTTLILMTAAALHTLVMLVTTAKVATTTNDIGLLFKFGFLYWGSPFLRFEPWPAPFATWATSYELATALGAIVFATAVIFGLLRLLKPGLGGTVALFGFAILVAVIVTGFAAGHSRATTGLLEAANKKYASFAALGWVGVLAILVGICRQTSKTSLSTNLVLAGFAALVLPLSLSAYPRETRVWQKMIDRNWEAVSAAAMGVNAKIWLPELYTDGQNLKAYLDFVEPKRRGLYSFFPFRWGDDVKTVLASRFEVRCRSQVGTLDLINPVDLADVFQGPGKAAKVSGWTWMTDEHAVPQMIVAADAQNHIVGAALVTRRGEKADEWLGQRFSENLEWWGFARLTEAAPYSFYALSADNRKFCSLGHVGDVR